MLSLIALLKLRLMSGSRNLFRMRQAMCLSPWHTLYIHAARELENGSVVLPLNPYLVWIPSNSAPMEQMQASKNKRSENQSHPRTRSCPAPWIPSLPSLRPYKLYRSPPETSAASWDSAVEPSNAASLEAWRAVKLRRVVCV